MKSINQRVIAYHQTHVLYCTSAPSSLPKTSSCTTLETCPSVSDCVDVVETGCTLASFVPVVFSSWVEADEALPLFFGLMLVMRRIIVEKKGIWEMNESLNI